MAKHPLFYQENPEDKRNRQENEYEEKLTGHLLARYGLSSRKAELRKQCQRVYGDSRLKVAEFVNLFEFPVDLTVTRIPGTVRNCALDKLFNKISTRKLVEHYFEARQESQSEKPFALVTPWTYIPKGMVLHEKSVAIDALPEGLTKPCVRMIWTLPKSKQKYGRYLVLEPVDSFLAGLNWSYSE